MLRKVSVLLVTLLLVSLTVYAQDAEPLSLTILHTNDTHAAHEPNGDGDGGVARQATVVQQIRAEVENSILVDAGDRFTGTLFHVQWLGEDNARIMNALGYDVMTLGNHEFDNGDDVLASFIDSVEFPVLTANVDFSASPFLADKVAPYIVMEIGGHQVGVIGLVAPETEILASPGPELVFEQDLVAVTQAAVDALSEQGINKVILLNHSGIDADIAIAEGVSGVDVIVGGHSHTLLANAYTGAATEYPLTLESPAGETVLIVQAGEKNEYLGRLDVTFDADGLLSAWEGDVIFLSRYITPDADVQALVEELAAPIEELRALEIGESATFLNGDRNVCRVEECLMGSIIADALRNETGAQIAIQNGGGVRASIDEGVVTLGEVLTVLPFGNLTSTLELSGADIVAALENGVSRVTLTPDGVIQRVDANGRFPQVSGISYTFDPTQEAGSRIVEVLLEDGTPIDPEAMYTVVTNDFMRNGGDGYSVMAENAVNAYDFGRPMDQVVADYIAANSPVSMEVGGRITATVGYAE